MISSLIERVLIPTDMSDFADLALQYALFLQKRLGTEITLLYATDLSFTLTDEYPLGYYLENVPAAKQHGL